MLRIGHGGDVKMRFSVLLLLLPLLLGSCGNDDSDPSMDLGGSLDPNIHAMEINEYTPRDKDYCVGQKLQPQFSEYDYQCQDALDKGECVQMPNPNLGKPFYCALCGLKGSKMICFMINPE